jgi:hypothetical protein
MNRVQTFCPQCEQEVEIHQADHLTPAGFEGRCGNCFYPFKAEDIAAAGKLHDELKAHDAKRHEIIAKHLGA